MVKIVEEQSKREKEWVRISDNMTKSTLEILSKEKIIYTNKNNSIFTVFGVLDLTKQNLMAIVRVDSGRISVYNKKFLSTALNLAERYENIAKESFLGEECIRKNWSLEKSYT